MKYNEDFDILKWLGISSRLYSLNLDKELSIYNLNSSLYYYIIKIYDETNITQDKLANLVYLNPSNVTRAINQLIKLGYVGKTQSKEDKRTSIISLTKVGIELYPKILKIIEDEKEKVLNIIPAEDREKFISNIKLIASNITNDK